MAHDLDFTKDGRARIAYAGHAVPWHRLGTSVKELQNIDEMLRASYTDYDVLLTKVAAVDDLGNLILNTDGTPVMIEDSRATVRMDIDGTFKSLATVGTRYEVRQNREVLERALAVVGASNGDAVIDTCGALKGGARFFATIDLGSIIIDPAGINDKISRYLVVSTGHDGVWPIRYANTDIRAVCSNTVVMGIKEAQRVFTARHTRNVDFAIDDAKTVLNLSTQWSSAFTKAAESMLKIDARPSTGNVDKVLNGLFPASSTETERQRKRRESIQDQIRSLYGNEKNAAKYGYNGWSLLNAIGEYLDHYRESTPTERAAASMDDTSHATRTKLLAHELVLSLSR
jgi:phage/plasmid-like protein (TIGR03299 family)